jgi:hypothetical protein
MVGLQVMWQAGEKQDPSWTTYQQPLGAWFSSVQKKLQLKELV